MAVATLMMGLLQACGPVLQQGTPLQDIITRDAAQANRPYRLLPGDQIEIHHVLDPDYSAVVAISPDQTITVPGLTERIHTQDKTLDELTAELSALYRSEHVLEHPFFSINLHSFANLQVFVGGEVQRPGYLDLGGGGERHVLQVITAAGGFLPTARTHEVIILRTPEPGKSEVFSVNIDKIMHGTDLTQNILIHPLDVVLVPRSDISSLDLWVDQYIRLALPIPVQGTLTYIGNNNNNNNAATTATGH